ncbi:nucleotidyltransferase family protein [Marinagarivorans algicola]|uniref:nucleotidyltransferase family protein n=1 Tax=Marinagarivorans algicola TaxID=1513270 RepID=UPI0006B679A4|nr:nucleotidyltransferase family protein [Marinagarivorans algicola]
MRTLIHQPVGFLVMAAGHSKRFGESCKLTAAFGGSTVLGCVLNQIQQACVHRPSSTADHTIAPAPIYIVTNTNNIAVQNLAKRYDAEAITLPAASAGLGCSLAYGVKATAFLSGWIVCLGDMPWIPAHIYAQVLQRAYNACSLDIGSLSQRDMYQAQMSESSPMKGVQIAPSLKGQRGHPVFFSQYYYSQLAALKGDKGASSLIDDRLQTFNIDNAQALQDIDTPQDIGIK